MRPHETQGLHLLGRRRPQRRTPRRTLPQTWRQGDVQPQPRPDVRDAWRPGVGRPAHAGLEPPGLPLRQALAARHTGSLRGLPARVALLAPRERRLDAGRRVDRERPARPDVPRRRRAAPLYRLRVALRRHHAWHDRQTSRSGLRVRPHHAVRGRRPRGEPRADGAQVELPLPLARVLAALRRGEGPRRGLLLLGPQLRDLRVRPAVGPARRQDPHHLGRPRRRVDRRRRPRPEAAEEGLFPATPRRRAAPARVSRGASGT